MRHTLTKANVVAFQIALCFGLWPASVYAAEVTLGGYWSKVPFASWLVVFTLSTIFGLGSLLNRLKVETPPRLKLYIAAQLLSSWLAGALAFFICELAGWEALAETLAIALAAYTGAAFIDRMTVAYLSKLSGGIPNGIEANPKAEQG